MWLEEWIFGKKVFKLLLVFIYNLWFNVYSAVREPRVEEHSADAQRLVRNDRLAAATALERHRTVAPGASLRQPWPVCLAQVCWIFFRSLFNLIALLVIDIDAIVLATALVRSLSTLNQWKSYNRRSTNSFRPVSPIWRCWKRMKEQKGEPPWKGEFWNDLSAAENWVQSWNSDPPFTCDLVMFFKPFVFRTASRLAATKKRDRTKLLRTK